MTTRERELLARGPRTPEELRLLAPERGKRCPRCHHTAPHIRGCKACNPGRLLTYPAYPAKED